jgi:hypothetical protein
MVSARFRGVEYAATADAIVEAAKPYPHGLAGVVLYVTRGELD